MGINQVQKIHPFAKRKQETGGICNVGIRVLIEVATA